MQAASKPAYEFGAFRLEVGEQRLLQDGRPLSVSPKVFDVLRVLVENSGHLVEKERLLAEVWPGSFVEEGALSRSISILRKTLGEGPSEQKFIETVPKRGYRFVAPVTEQRLDGSKALDGLSLLANGAGEATTPASVMAPPKRRFARPSIATSVAGVIGFVIGLLWPASWRTAIVRWAAGVAGVLFATFAFMELTQDDAGIERAAAVSTVMVKTHQVTSTGNAQAPAISKDGKRIAYVSDEKPEKRLVVQDLTGGQPVTVFAALEIGSVRWSPDGTELIAWAHVSSQVPGSAGLYALSPSGGTPRRIDTGGQGVACWSPDGSEIALARDDVKWIRFFNKSGRSRRNIELKQVVGTVDGSIEGLDWSAKGVLTFVATDSIGHSTIWTVNLDGSAQRPLVVADSQIPWVHWAASGDAIYYSQRVNQSVSLLKVRYSPGDETNLPVPKTLIAGLESDGLVGLSGDGHLVYARAPFSSNLWLVDANTRLSDSPETKQLTRGTELVERPSLSPDASSIAFSSGHHAVTNLFKLPITGGDSMQLTFRDSLNLQPVWSADGKQIAFGSTEGGQLRVWAVDASGGEPRLLSSSDLSDSFDLAWAPGPRLLYQRFLSRSYYELDRETREERSLVSDPRACCVYSPVYSPGGREVAVVWNRESGSGIWTIDMSNRHEQLVYPTASFAKPIGWSSDADSIYVLKGKKSNVRGVTTPGGETVTEAKVLRVPVNGGQAKTVIDLPFEEIGGVTMTPDGRKFVSAVYSSRSDIWVVDNVDPSP